MKFSYCTSSSCLSEYQDTLVKVVQQTIQDRSTHVPDARQLASATMSYSGISFSRKVKDIGILILLSWYSDWLSPFEEYFRLEIHEYLRRRRLFTFLSASCESKAAATLLIPWVLFKDTNQLVSYLKDKKVRKRLQFFTKLRIEKPRTPRKPIRRRGYKDKGGLRPAERWLPSHDWSLTRKQQEIEKNREFYDLCVSLLLEYAGGRLSGDLCFEIYSKGVDPLWEKVV